MSSFRELIKNSRDELIANPQPEFDVTINKLYDALAETQSSFLSEIYSNSQGFLDRNYERWKDGFDLMRLFYHYCMEAGQAFQEEILKYSQFTTDALLGVLMQIHAHSCRVTGEIITLLINGYADGALSRWRTLHEFAVTSLVLSKYGREAAEDYVQYGIVQYVDGMKSYQETAVAMHREPFSTEELERAIQNQKEILKKYGTDFCSSNGWARKYVNGSKFNKLQKDVGLEKWSNDYKIASRNIHTDWREMRSLFAMGEADAEILLCGPSNSGMVEPAHYTAMALEQVTCAFIFTYINEDDSPIDHSESVIFMGLIHRLAEDIGSTFLELHKQTQR
jgi:hypothetical protein